MPKTNKEIAGKYCHLWNNSPGRRDLAMTILEAINEATAQLAPKWSKELPDSDGEFWWTDGKKEPKETEVFKSCGKIYADASYLRNYNKVSEMGGYWLEILTPPLPKGGEV